MKRITFIVISLFFLFTIPLVSYAEVNVTIGIPAPLAFTGPPDVVVVPSGDAYVYMVPDTPGLYFYNNYWYRFDRNRWYRSRAYNGSWVFIEPDLVPGYILDVPPDYYLRLPRGYHRIHYRDFHSHWRNWDRDRHWHKQNWYKREHREHQRWRRDHPRPHRDHRDGRGGHDGRGHDGGKRDGGGQKTHPDDRRGMRGR